MFERVAERKIREALEDGRLGGDPRPGVRIELEEYFQTPEDVRLAYSVLKSAGCVPEEVDRLKELAVLQGQMQVAPTDEARRSVQAQIARVQLRLDLARERSRRRSP